MTGANPPPQARRVTHDAAGRIVPPYLASGLRWWDWYLLHLPRPPEDEVQPPPRVEIVPASGVRRRRGVAPT